jgi:hypothetical protein
MGLVKICLYRNKILVFSWYIFKNLAQTQSLVMFTLQARNDVHISIMEPPYRVSGSVCLVYSQHMVIS